jgi:hypothetical protein
VILAFDRSALIVSAPCSYSEPPRSAQNNRTGCLDPIDWLCWWVESRPRLTATARVWSRSVCTTSLLHGSLFIRRVVCCCRSRAPLACEGRAGPHAGDGPRRVTSRSPWHQQQIGLTASRAGRDPTVCRLPRRFPMRLDLDGRGHGAPSNDP